MKVSLKKVALALGVASLSLVIGVVGPRLLKAAYDNNTATGSTNLRTGNLKITDTGIYDSNGTLRWTPGSANALVGNQSISGGQQSMGAVGTALSSLNTSGFSSGNLYYATLTGTVAAVEGSVLVATTSVSSAISVIVAPATAGLTNFVGCASAATSTGSVVGVYSAGSWALCLTTGTVVAGDQLAVSAITAGYLYAPTTGTNSLLSSTATVGVALTAGTAAGARARVRLK